MGLEEGLNILCPRPSAQKHYQVLVGPEDMGDVFKVELIQSCVRLNGVFIWWSI
jgi:hypothetical protein